MNPPTYTDGINHQTSVFIGNFLVPSCAVWIHDSLKLGQEHHPVSAEHNNSSTCSSIEVFEVLVSVTLQWIVTVLHYSVIGEQ